MRLARNYCVVRRSSEPFETNLSRLFPYIKSGFTPCQLCYCSSMIDSRVVLSKGAPVAWSCVMHNKKFIPVGLTAGFALLVSSLSIGTQNAAFAAYGNDDHRFSLQSVLRSLGSQDHQRRQEIERLLNERKSEAPTILTNALDSADPEVQKNASDLLARMSHNWEFVINDRSLATIIVILKNTHVSQVKCNLVRVIGNVGPRHEHLQPIILDLLKKDEDVTVRSAAADSLANFTREEKPGQTTEAIKVMSYCLKNDISPHVRRSVAQAMGNLPPSDAVILALMTAMDDNYKQVRTVAGSSLSRFGVRAKQALPQLLKAYNEEQEWHTRQQALSAMIQIDRKNPKVVEAVVVGLDDPQLMHASLSYLQQLGVDAAPAVPRLIKILEPENNINVRMQTANTLGAIGPKAQLALPTLNKLSETAEGMLKDSVDNAIRRIGATGQTRTNQDNFVGGAVL